MPKLILYRDNPNTPVETHEIEYTDDIYLNLNNHNYNALHDAIFRLHTPTPTLEALFLENLEIPIDTAIRYMENCYPHGDWPQFIQYATKRLTHDLRTECNNVRPARNILHYFSLHPTKHTIEIPFEEIGITNPTRKHRCFEWTNHEGKLRIYYLDTFKGRIELTKTSIKFTNIYAEKTKQGIYVEGAITRAIYIDRTDTPDKKPTLTMTITTNKRDESPLTKRVRIKLINNQLCNKKGEPLHLVNHTEALKAYKRITQDLNE